MLFVQFNHKQNAGIECWECCKSIRNEYFVYDEIDNKNYCIECGIEKAKGAENLIDS